MYSYKESSVSNESSEFLNNIHLICCGKVSSLKAFSLHDELQRLNFKFYIILTGEKKIRFLSREAN